MILPPPQYASRFDGGVAIQWQMPARTRAADDSSLASTKGPEKRRLWEKTITLLREWGLHPNLVQDDDFDAPTVRAVQAGIVILNGLPCDKTPSFTRVVPTGDGGIAIEWDSGKIFRSIRIEADGAAEFRQFIEGKLRSREIVDWQPN